MQQETKALVAQILIANRVWGAEQQDTFQLLFWRQVTEGLTER